MVAIALVRLDLANANGPLVLDLANANVDADATQLVGDLLARCGASAALALIEVLVHLQANAVTVLAQHWRLPVMELLDDFEEREFLERVREH